MIDHQGITFPDKGYTVRSSRGPRERVARFGRRPTLASLALSPRKGGRERGKAILVLRQKIIAY